MQLRFSTRNFICFTPGCKFRRPFASDFGTTLLPDSAYFTMYDLVIVWIQLGSIMGFYGL